MAVTSRQLLEPTPAKTGAQLVGIVRALREFVLRPLALSWLVFEGVWALFQAFLRWPAPEAQVWLMDLALVYLVARQLMRGATVGRALVVIGGMFLWAPYLYATASLNRSCGTHAVTVGFEAMALVIIKTVILVSAVVSRMWRRARDGAEVETSGRAERNSLNAQGSTQTLPAHVNGAAQPPSHEGR